MLKYIGLEANNSHVVCSFLYDFTHSRWQAEWTRTWDCVRTKHGPGVQGPLLWTGSMVLPIFLPIKKVFQTFVKANLRPKQKFLGLRLAFMNVWDTFCIGKTMNPVQRPLVHVLSLPHEIARFCNKGMCTTVHVKLSKKVITRYMFCPCAQFFLISCSPN